MSIQGISSYIHTVGDNKVAVVQKQIDSTTTSSQIAAVAAEKLPDLTPDKACVTAIFNTGKRLLVLTNSRINPDVTEKTVDGTDYPKQIEASVGGALRQGLPFTTETPFKEALAGHLKTKLLLSENLVAQNPANEEANKTMSQVIQSILGNLRNTFAIHTNTGTWKMKVITAISRIDIKEEEVDLILNASRLIATAKKAAGVHPREILEVELREFQPLVDTADKTADIVNETEIAKAAYAIAKEERVTFNNYAIATLFRNGAFANL